MEQHFRNYTREITNFRKKVEDNIVGNWEEGMLKKKNFSQSPLQYESKQGQSIKGNV